MLLSYIFMISFKNHINKIAMGIVKFRDQLVAAESHEADNTAVDATNSTLDLESDFVICGW